MNSFHGLVLETNGGPCMLPPRQLDEMPGPESWEPYWRNDLSDYWRRPASENPEGSAQKGSDSDVKKKKSKKDRRKKQPVADIDIDNDYHEDDEDNGDNDEELIEDELLDTELADVSDVDWREMLKTMKCIKCDLLPNPEWRYLCQNGHQYCHGCYKELILNEGGLCTAKTEKTELERLETQPAVFNFRGFVGLDDYYEEGEVDRRCKEDVKHHRPDPIYTALFNNFKFKCPNSGNGCEGGFPGVEVFSHYDLCPKMEAQCKISEDNDEEPEMEQSTAF